MRRSKLGLFLLAPLMLAACAGDDAPPERADEPTARTTAPAPSPAPPPTDSAAQSYAACMDEANRLPSQAEATVKALRCRELPDAPRRPPNLPADIPPPPAPGERH